MSAVCVDASLVLAWLLPNDQSSAAYALNDRWQAGHADLIAPHLLVFEVTSVLRQAVYRGQISAEEGEEALAAFRGMGIRLVQTDALVERAWTWGKNVNAAKLYDMYYVAAAAMEDCDLWTVDRRLVNLVSSRSTFVRWVGEVRVEAVRD